MIAIKGVKIATTNCGIKYKNRDDLLLVTFDKEISVAGVFTSSSMPAAPVSWCKKNIQNKSAKALIVNAGNANAFTGKHGEEVVTKTAEEISKCLPCKNSQVFISSTGVIGETLNYNLITQAIPNLVKNLKSDQDSWNKAAKAIMTTDTKEKLVSKTCKILDEKITITGFAKGSGMIAPNMATMLGYIFCDANISSDALSIILKEITEDTFNSITVDSDQSTNDTVLLFATKESKHQLIDNPFDQNLDSFKKALHALMLELAQMIVIDGEGAKKLIEITVSGAENKKQAKDVALSIGNSPLVKTAIAGCDPNWGRIVMAVGKSCSETSPEKLVVKIGDYQLTKDGAKHPNYVEKTVHEYLKNSFVKITVDLGIKSGEESIHATIWTCDLNEEYIKINKDYRS
ncbi:MAG: bifunctional glutamate N-acetyltransferase/amino-acid acetyltransferase ArgJ [Rickettsiales bacterium]|nr:bifunctional glutamate N-acetyltransferase/amino-acid acetyltransferase ArgJ [Rickettsiales bacterium]